MNSYDGHTDPEHGAIKQEEEMKNTTLGRRVQSAEGHEMVVVTEEQWDDDTEADDLLR